MPGGVASNVATVATRSESRIAVHSVGVMSNTWADAWSNACARSGRRLHQIGEAVLLQHRLGCGGMQIVEIVLRFRLGRGGRCHRIDDRGMGVGREGAA